MNVGASGPHSGPTAIVAATNTAHHAGRTTWRPIHTTPSRPTSPSVAVKSWTSGDVAAGRSTAIGAAIST